MRKLFILTVFLMSANLFAGETGKLKGITAIHNEIRQEAGVKPLVWSDEIAAYAQAWANQLKAKGCNMNKNPHRPKPWKFGENIAAGPPFLTARRVMNMWYSEKEYWNPYSEVCVAENKNCFHYLQIVRKSATAVGCGIASCGST